MRVVVWSCKIGNCVLQPDWSNGDWQVLTSPRILMTNPQITRLCLNVALIIVIIVTAIVCQVPTWRHSLWPAPTGLFCLSVSLSVWCRAVWLSIGRSNGVCVPYCCPSSALLSVISYVLPSCLSWVSPADCWILVVCFLLSPVYCVSLICFLYAAYNYVDLLLFVLRV